MRCSSNEFDWSAVAIVRLQLLWAEGHSTTEIGRRMGVSKNAIVGKAHRLNLPARPSRSAGMASASRRSRAGRVAQLCRHSRAARGSQALPARSGLWPLKSGETNRTLCGLRRLSRRRCRFAPRSAEPTPVAGPSVSRGRAPSATATPQTRPANRIAPTTAGSPTSERNRNGKQPDQRLRNRGTGGPR